MLFFDQLKKNDPQLRLLTMVVLGGLGVLLAGLWWVQIVSARDYQARLETQSFRTVRLPAVRGKILDRTGVALADSRPSFNASLYFEELRKPFDAAYAVDLAALRRQLHAQMTEQEHALKHPLTRKERARFALSADQKNALRQRARYQVASNLVAYLSARLQQPAALDEQKFQRHYASALVLPYPVLLNLDPTNLARFEEQSVTLEGLDLEMQPVRVYPYQTTAAHLLGQLRRDISSAEGEDSFLNYPLPVFRGTVGLEAAFDAQLRGRSGSKSVLVNNLGYRQSESVWSAALPGENVVLTLDLRLQQAAERALAQAMTEVRGAVVVLDPRNGDILALASAPSYDPNMFVRGLTPAEGRYLSDARLRPQINRAVQENYSPGSIFKIIVGLAALESGLDPRATYHVQPDPASPGHGCIFVGRQKIRDLAAPGDYDFHRALLRSSNAYFITNGLRAGIENILRLTRRLHLGELCGLPTRQEVRGNMPTLPEVRARWTAGETANVCIGQGEVDVTPLQVAVVTAAIANGGKVLYPRLVAAVAPQDPFSGGDRESFPGGQVRDELGVRPRNLQLVREAMLAETEDLEGTGYAAFHRGKPGAPILPTFRVCGKTGTAQVKDASGRTVDHTTWFTSFAPYEDPRYVVVVMVESGGSGGGTAAPVARDIYLKIEELERAGAFRLPVVAQKN